MKKVIAVPAVLAAAAIGFAPFVVWTSPPAHAYPPCPNNGVLLGPADTRGGEGSCWYPNDGNLNQHLFPEPGQYPQPPARPQPPVTVCPVRSC